MGDKVDGGELKRVNSYQVGKPLDWNSNLDARVYLIPSW
jgi:hypothetical protein